MTCDMPQVRRETVGLADKGPRATAVANALVALPLLKTTLEAGRKPTMEGCVAMAYQVFYQLFRDKIVDLTSQCVCPCPPNPVHVFSATPCSRSTSP